jgi:hypothetical protein
MNSSESYLSRNRSLNSSHDTSSTTMYSCGGSVFHHRRALPFSWKDRHADLHVGGIIAKCEAHRHLFPTMPRWPCLSGHPRTREIDPFEFLVKATYNGRRARRNLSGCRRPRLVSVQSFDQCREHVLTRSHHPNQHHELLFVIDKSKLKPTKAVVKPKSRVEPALIPYVTPLLDKDHW